MSRTTRKQLTGGFLGLGLASVLLVGQVSAQPGDAARPNGDRPAGDVAANNRVTRDEGFNPGWLGLLGLAGLAGLMPKKVQTVTTTHRTGDAPIR